MTDGVDEALPEAALKRLLALSPEMCAKEILELKRRLDGGLVLRKPKPTDLASSVSVESISTSTSSASTSNGLNAHCR